MMRDAVFRLPLIWTTSPSVKPSSAMAERGMRAMPPPRTSALALATCSLTCFALSGASAKACPPHIIRYTTIGRQFQDSDLPATEGSHIAQQQHIRRRAAGDVHIPGNEHGPPPHPP